MSLIQAIILGIVQGLTEFLPVSSSAHLVIVPYLAGWQLDKDFSFVFDILVQLGTLTAVLYYFREDLWQILQAWLAGIRANAPLKEANSRLGWYLILATIPAGLGGLLLKDKVEAAFASPVITAGFLFLTAVILTLAEIIHQRDEQRGEKKALDKMSWADALWIGLSQVLALFPGVSRSGATISAGIARRLDRQGAARFSFLMSIPIMLAAGALGLKDLLEMPGVNAMALPMLAGFIIAGIVGYLVIRWFLNYLRGRSLLPFAAYCALVSLLVIAVSYFRF